MATENGRTWIDEGIERERFILGSWGNDISQVRRQKIPRSVWERVSKPVWLAQRFHFEESCGGGKAGKWGWYA